MRMFLIGLVLGANALFARADALAPCAEVPSRARGAAPAPAYEPALTRILQRIATEDGLVRHDLLRGPLRDDFRRVLRAVETFDAARLVTDEEKLAFWINAYNVQMLQHIIEAPGVENVIAEEYARRFFRTPVCTAGLPVTLDEIEHVILRRRDGPDRLHRLRVAVLDPRIHVGLHCAARGCPPLQPAAFTAARIDDALDAALREFVNSPAHFRAERDGFVLSALLDWFGADFDRHGLPAGDYLLAYMSPERPGYAALRRLLRGRTAAEIRRQPNVRFAYDWTVNAADAASFGGRER